MKPVLLASSADFSSRRGFRAVQSKIF